MSDSLCSLLEAVAACEIVDLSKDVNAPRPHGPFTTKIEVLEPGPGARFFTEKLIPQHFPEGVGRIRPESFPDARFLRHEMVTLSTHAGSHVDAPGHYGGPLSPESFVDATQVRDFIGPGVYFDGSGVRGEEVGWADLQEVAKRQGIAELSGHIVLIRTGPDKGVGADAVGALLDRGVKVIGTDHESLDGPFKRMLRRYVETGESKALWPCHMLGRDRPYYQYENLNNLDKLPPKDFMVWGPPVLVSGATASWARVIALVPRRSEARRA